VLFLSECEIRRWMKIRWEGTHLKRDGKSHPANIRNRAFGDNWPGFPLNLARYGSESLTGGSIRST